MERTKGRGFDLYEDVREIQGTTRSGTGPVKSGVEDPDVGQYI